MNYKFAFFGTPRFAEIVLEELIAQGLIPSVVICNPDRPVGRKKIITPPPTKLLAQKHNIAVSQPEKLEAETWKAEVGEIDFTVVAAYGKIIPKEILNTPKFSTLGIHPSLLPKHRGASPIQTAILDGDEETGVSLFLVDEKVDHGKIIAEDATIILANDTYLSLEKRLAKLGADLLITTLPEYIGGKIIPKEQDEGEATFTKKFETQNGFIASDVLDAALQGEKAFWIHKKICALNPEPGVWTIKNEKRMKLLESELRGEKLVLKKIQIEGKTPQILN
ncbi:MAG: methionyl-tRNA formyltransferase [Patescibacteria group bacterium]